MKRRLALSLFVVIAVAGIITWRAGREDPELPEQPPPPTTTAPRPNDVPPARATEALRPKSERDMWSRFAIAVDQHALDAALATGDPAEWRPILGQARHFNVPREKGVELLRRYLSHADPAVRAAAAEFLFELGERDGGPVLRELLAEAAAGRSVAADPTHIAGILHQYRFPVDGNLLHRVYRQTHDSRLLMYAQLMGSTEAVPETLERLKTQGVLDGAMMMAGMMGLKDPAALAVYEANLASHSAVAREQANWAMYRATGEQRYLDYLIGVAEEQVGLRPRSRASGGDAGPLSFQALQQTRTPETTIALRRIEQAARSSRRSVEANRALLGLFYLHEDYEYVDALVLAQFSGTLPADGLQIASIWELAAARRTPGIDAAARAYNLEAYDREFIRKAGRPVESWVFQYMSSAIPVDVRPPLGP